MITATIKRLLPSAVRHGLSRGVFAIRYGGTRHECPFCGGRFRKLLPHGESFPVLHRLAVVGAGRRANSECPQCFSFDRERLIYLYLRERTELFTRPTKLLHVAPETNLHRVLSTKPNIDYVTADLCSPLAALKIDVTNIPCSSCSFDAIICNHVLEHVPDDRKAISELLRVLRPGGWAILQVPIALSLEATYENESITTPADREAEFGQRDHVRLYGRDYQRRLSAAGFEVETFQALEQFGPENVRKYALLPQETLYVCRKSQ